jgi:hypothetical protein
MSGRPLRLAQSVSTIAWLALALCCGDSPSSPSTTATLKVLGPQAILLPGEAVQLQAMRYAAKSSVDLARAAAWRTSNTSVATVSTTGLVTGVAVGDADVSATVEGLTATIGIRVADSRGTLTGRIEQDVAADIIAQNQDISYNKHKGTIMRFDLPVRVYVDRPFGAFGDCGQRGVRAWQDPTGLPIVFIEANAEPRIQMIVMAVEGNQPRTALDVVNLDNSLRGVSLIMPLSWGGGCDDPVEDTMIHEVGHALGLCGHPDWDGAMAYHDGWDGLRRPNARELRFVTELYKLPLGAHVEPDGTWVVR